MSCVSCWYACTYCVSSCDMRACVTVSSCARAEGVFADEVHALEEGQTASHEVLIVLSCPELDIGTTNRCKSMLGF